jgi:STE24 endopeptidase
MKMLLAVACVALTTLFVLTTFVDFPAERERARHYFSEPVVEVGREYAARGRWIFWGSTAVHLAFLAGLVYLGFGRRLADWAGRLTGRRWFLTLVAVTAVCFLVDQLLKIPFRLAGLEVARQYGMTTLSWPAWFEDFAKTVALGGLLQVGVFAGLYLLMAWLPRAWWVVAGFLSVALGCLFALVLPVWVSPLFNDFRPLKDPTLEKSVLDLAGRAGVAVREVLVMDASRRTRHTNAYFTGFGATRRIVLYDTLLREPATNAAGAVAVAVSPCGQGPLLAATYLAGAKATTSAEVSSVLAHEIGHWKHDHIVKGIALADVGAFVGLFVLSLILRGNVGRPPLYLRGITDPAGVPLILLLFSLGNWLVMPLENAISREFERQADWTALELTQDPQVFIAAEKNLATSNLGDVAPNPISQWFFSTHPSAVERIEAAKRWQREHAGER